MKKVEDQSILTANELTDVSDIRRNFLYTKSGYIFGYLRIFPIDIDLLSKSEIVSYSKTLTGSFKSIDHPFTFLCIPRTVDINDYINFLSSKYDDEIESATKKKIISTMIHEGQNKIMGDNFEHQYFIRVWLKYNESENCENKILNMLNTMSNRYELIHVRTQILDETDILQLCNLYANSSTASLELDTEFNGIPFIENEKRG